MIKVSCAQNGPSCAGDFMCTGTLGIRVNFELHLIAGRNLNSLLNIAHVNEKNTLVEYIVIATCLLDDRFLLFHHLLDLILDFTWQFAEIAWFDPTVTLASLQKSAEIEIIARLLAALLGALLFVLRSDFFLPC